MQQLRALALRHAVDGCRELLPRLTLWSSPAATAPTAVVYEPMLYFTLQGTKQMEVGERRLVHRPGTFLLAAVDVPVVCEVDDCSPSAPYLGIALALDPATLAALLLDVPAGPERALELGARGLESMAIGRTNRVMEDALLRALRLVDAPDDVPLLWPMVERELLYRVLQTEHGTMLRQLACEGSRLCQIQRAVKWIRAHLTETVPVETLAGVAAMSVSSFHRHFKAVTGLSPLAYHKQMRLREARHAMPPACARADAGSGLPGRTPQHRKGVQGTPRSASEARRSRMGEGCISPSKED